MKKVKALVLLSGGLDSMLAAKTLMEQDIEVTGLSFISCFFGAGKAVKVAEQLGIELKKIDFKEEHLKMAKNPKYGYGKNANPCIDCHSMMLRYAGEYLTPQPPLLTKRRGEKVGKYDFIATGEVLGQRPMSQNKGSLAIVAKYSGLNGRLVRPLSAKLLEETDVEKQSLVDRDKLLDISGRSRNRQTKLARKYNLEYPTPAGGCLLTDPKFSDRLLEMFKRWPDCKPVDIELLKHGRVFWVGKDALIIVGRNKEDCEELEKLARKGDVMIELEVMKGPLTVVRSIKCQNPNDKSNPNLEIPKELDVDKLKLDGIKDEEEVLEMAGLLTGWYAPKMRGQEAKLKIRYIGT